MKIDPLWQQKLFKHLSESDVLGAEAVQYIRQRGVRLYFLKHSKNTGARWSIFRHISLNSLYYSLKSDLKDPKLLSLIVHEVHHLKQGARVAWSVYGELDAWQVEYFFYKKLTGKTLHPALEELLGIPLTYDKTVLRHVVTLMHAYAGKGYHADWLPLRPLGYPLLDKNSAQ